MDISEFETSLQHRHPPGNISVYLKALWYDGKEDWDKAHEMIQDIDDATAAWIHAYLHRKEGDSWNADYWYRKANRTRPNIHLKEEWKQISERLLNDD